MKDHVLLFGWFALTAVVNYLLRTKSAGEWEALAEKNPRYAAFARLLRAVGVDPVKLIESGADLVRGKAQAAARAAMVAPVEEEPKADAVDAPQADDAVEAKPEPTAEEAKVAEAQAALVESVVKSVEGARQVEVDAASLNGKSGGAKPGKGKQQKRQQEKKRR